VDRVFWPLANALRIGLLKDLTEACLLPLLQSKPNTLDLTIPFQDVFLNGEYPLSVSVDGTHPMPVGITLIDNII
jgi:hypothetical protein